MKCSLTGLEGGITDQRSFERIVFNLYAFSLNLESQWSHLCYSSLLIKFPVEKFNSNNLISSIHKRCRCQVFSLDRQKCLYSEKTIKRQLIYGHALSNFSIPFRFCKKLLPLKTKFEQTAVKIYELEVRFYYYIKFPAISFFKLLPVHNNNYRKNQIDRSMIHKFNIFHFKKALPVGEIERLLSLYKKPQIMREYELT